MRWVIRSSEEEREGKIWVSQQHKEWRPFFFFFFKFSFLFGFDRLICEYACLLSSCKLVSFLFRKILQASTANQITCDCCTIHTIYFFFLWLPYLIFRAGRCKWKNHSRMEFLKWNCNVQNRFVFELNGCIATSDRCIIVNILKYAFYLCKLILMYSRAKKGWKRHEQKWRNVSIVENWKIVASNPNYRLSIQLSSFFSRFTPWLFRILCSVPNQITPWKTWRWRSWRNLK